MLLHGSQYGGNSMMERAGRFLGAALVGALTCTATVASDLNLSVLSGGSSVVEVGPGDAVSYEVIGVLSDDANEGLAGAVFDLAFSGGDLMPADTPVEPSPMAAFVIPDGITNPAGYGGTLIDGDLVQVCGAQNTINNNVENAPFPIGEVITGVASPSSPEVLVTGSLTAPMEVGTYTLSASGIVVTVIREGETGDGEFWATEMAGEGAITQLTITVPGGTSCDTDPNYLGYHACVDPAGKPPYDIDCRVWACDDTDMCVEIPSEGLSPDGTYNLYGDVNDDGSVTPTDVSCLQRWAAGTVVPPFTGCDKGGAGGPIVEFEYIDFAPCRDPKNPDGRGDGSLTPTEISYVQFVGAGTQTPIGDCYYCGGN
jgi:hypothetical protein